MATASAILCKATVTVRVRSSCSTTQKGERKVVYIGGGLNSYGGLKAHTRVTAMGVPVCTEQCFANVVSSLRAQGRGGGGGGALSSTCNAADEIFRIAAIVNGLVLVGVAVGFVLLRIEASVEESE